MPGYRAVLPGVRLAASSHICPCLILQSADGGLPVRRGQGSRHESHFARCERRIDRGSRASCVNEEERPRLKAVVSGPQATPRSPESAPGATAWPDMRSPELIGVGPDPARRCVLFREIRFIGLRCAPGRRASAPPSGAGRAVRRSAMELVCEFVKRHHCRGPGACYRTRPWSPVAK